LLAFLKLEGELHFRGLVCNILGFSKFKTSMHSFIYCIF
jgi:hypothetical protein